MLANELARIGQTKEAGAVYEAVIAAHPQTLDAYKLLGGLLVRQNDFAAAVQVFERGLEAIPQSLDLELLLADTVQRTGDPQRAERRLAGLLAGACLTAAFAPHDQWYLALLAPAVLLLLWRGAATAREGALLGFWFALGVYAAGTWGLYISIRRGCATTTPRSSGRRWKTST